LTILALIETASFLLPLAKNLFYKEICMQHSKKILTRTAIKRYSGKHEIASKRN